MIPIIYKLRENIRFEARGNSFLVISEAPLNVVLASRRAVRILQLCDGKRTIPEIARDSGVQQEDQVFRICDYFNRKSVLGTSILENQGYFPAISVIVPTRDRGEAVVECIESIYLQDYDSDKIEVIVIDDGSLDETRELLSRFPCTLLTNPTGRGQSYCRNLGARYAKNEILAFIDDDCVAGQTWLRDLAPYFQWREVGGVGGYVDGYDNKSSLDQYEKEFSLLNLGKYIFRSLSDQFFVPACNMLVRKNAFIETGGIREALHIGEDVDFCWRMRDAGWQALYVPSGIVRHKHRNTLWRMLRRRADYGTSEAVLSSLHPNRKKILQWRPLAAAGFIGLCCAIASLTLYPLILTVASVIAESTAKDFRLHSKRIRISYRKLCLSVLRTYFSYFYTMTFHLDRYYLVPLFLLGFAFPTLWGLAFSFLLFAACVDYSKKRPRLSFLIFLFFYFLDHMSYQLGVLAGCLRARSFRSYLVRFNRRLDAV